MFWNASELKNIFPTVNFYPQLMAMDISNCHGRLNNKLISKVNIYNTMTDKLQKEKNGIAIKFQNIGKAICDLAHLGNGKGANGFLKIIHDFKERKDKLERNVSSLMTSKIGTRAEFRINLNRIHILTSTMQRLFSGEDLNRKAIYLSSESVADWSLITIQMLCAPIESCLALATTQFKEGNYNLFEQSVVTISAFESLLCSTFFSGMPYSHASAIIWKKSNGPDLRSIELMKSIINYNRIVIPDSFWLERCLAIKSLQFSEIIQKIATIERFGLMSNFNLVRILTDPLNNPLDEAIAIWKSYFDCLSENDFIAGIDRWKCVSIIDTRKFTYNRLNIIDCIEKIFNIERLSAPQSKWKRIFLLAFSDWVDSSRKSNLNERIKKNHSILENAAIKIGIELVHYYGDSSLSFYGSCGRYIRINRDVTELNLTHSNLLSQSIPVIRQDNSSITSSSTSIPVCSGAAINSSTTQRKKRETFTLDEITCLVDGYKKYHSDKFKWSKIISDTDYCFFANRNRNGEQLKDKFRNLIKNNEIIIENGAYILNMLKSDLKRRQITESNLNNQDIKLVKIENNIDIPISLQEFFYPSSAVLTPRNINSYSTIEQNSFQEINSNVPVIQTPRLENLYNLDDTFTDLQEEPRQILEPDYDEYLNEAIIIETLENNNCKKFLLKQILFENIQINCAVMHIFEKVCELSGNEPFSWSIFKSKIYLKYRPNEEIWDIIKNKLLEKNIIICKNNLLYINL